MSSDGKYQLTGSLNQAIEPLPAYMYESYDYGASWSSVENQCPGDETSVIKGCPAAAVSGNGMLRMAGSVSGNLYRLELTDPEAGPWISKGAQTAMGITLGTVAAVVPIGVASTKKP